MTSVQPPGIAALTAAQGDPTGYLRASMPMCATLGFEATHVALDSVKLSVAHADGLCTARQVIHGGVIMALADAAGALLAYFNLPDGASGTTTIESKTNFLGAARSGTLTADARVLHAGRTTIVVETFLQAAGAPVAKTTQTQLVLMRPMSP